MNKDKPHELTKEENLERVYLAVEGHDSEAIKIMLERWEHETWQDSDWHKTFFKTPDVFLNHRQQVMDCCRQILAERLIGVSDEPSPRDVMKHQFEG